MKKLISILGIAIPLAVSSVYADNLPIINVEKLPNIRGEQLVGHVFTKEFFMLQYHIDGKKGDVAFYYPVRKGDSPLFCPISFADDLNDDGIFNDKEGEVSMIEYGDKKPQDCILYSLPKEKEEPKTEIPKIKIVPEEFLGDKKLA